MKIPTLSVQNNISLVWKKEDQADFSLLKPKEKAIAEQIKHPARRTQFILGRIAITEALLNAGFNGATEILKGSRGEPLLPKEYCGSISHCYLYSDGNKQTTIALAGAANVSKTKFLGIDIEHQERLLSKEIQRHICSKNESDWANQGDLNQRLIMIASSKEALFKLIFPSSQVYFGMQDAELIWNEDTSSFRATLLKSLDQIYTKGCSYNINVYTKDNLLISLAAI